MNTELKVSNHLHGFARRLVAEGLMDEQAALEAAEAEAAAEASAEADAEKKEGDE